MSSTQAPSADELGQIDQDLNKLNVNDLDTEFKQIDQGLGSL